MSAIPEPAGVLQQLDVLIAAAEPPERPALVVALSARLAALGAGMAGQQAVATREADEVLTVPEMARRLGLSAAYVYAHSKDLPFAYKEGGRLLGSALGLARYQQRARRK